MPRMENHNAVIATFLKERESDGVRLRPAVGDDSDFLLSLRLNPERNRNLSATRDDLAAQRAWMEDYVRRHAQEEENYFVIMAAQEPVGSVRMYDYRRGEGSFCWGSWIIRPGAAPAVAYQSMMLVYDLAFGPLGFVRSHFDVRQANASVWRFHERMGARLVGETPLERHYHYARGDYLQARQRLLRFAQGRAFGGMFLEGT